MGALPCRCRKLPTLIVEGQASGPVGWTFPSSIVVRRFAAGAQDVDYLNGRKIRAVSKKPPVRKLDLEGVVGKQLVSIYEPGERSGAWINHHTNIEQEFVIGGYVPGGRGFDALLVCVYENKHSSLWRK